MRLSRPYFITVVVAVVSCIIVM